MSALAAAIEAARKIGNLGPVVAALKSGMTPTPDEWANLATVEIDRVSAEIRHRAMALRRYRELRQAKVPVADASQMIATEFNLHLEIVRYVIAQQKDRRVVDMADAF